MTTKVGVYKEKRNKNKPWVVRWFGEYDPAKGKQRHYSKSFARKRDAESFAAAKQSELDQGQPRDRFEDVTLAEFLARFVETYCCDLRVSTRQLYHDTFQQLEGHFGPNTALRQISPEAASSFIASRKRLSRYGTGYSVASRTKHLRHCKTAFGLAVEWGYLRKNPFTHIKLSRIGSRRWHHLKPDEFRALVEVAPSSRWRSFYYLAYTTGARLGELFNLTWADVDFQRRNLTITDRPPTEELPPFLVKDHESRTLPLPKQTIKTLHELWQNAPSDVPFILLTSSRWRLVLEKWQLCHQGKPWQRNKKTGQMVWGEWENRFMVNNVLRDMRAHVKKAGLVLTAPMTVHTLRKSFAQNHADSGTPSSTLKALMGHASITTTEKHYLQQSDDNSRAATNRYEGLL